MKQRAAGVWIGPATQPWVPLSTLEADYATEAEADAAYAAKAAPGILLASKHHDPAAQEDPAVSTTTFEDVDATNLVLPDFVAPASGLVDVTLAASVSVGVASTGQRWNIRDGSGDLANSDGYVAFLTSTSQVMFITYKRRIAVTPAATITGWKWGHARTGGSGNVFIDIGGANLPGALMQVHAA